MTRTLNRTKPYGETTPPEDGIRFHQDGADFDVYGNFVRMAGVFPIEGGQLDEPEPELEPASIQPAPVDPDAPDAPTTVSVLEAPYSLLLASAKSLGFTGRSRADAEKFMADNAIDSIPLDPPPAPPAAG